VETHYVANVSHVREVTLLGTADLTYWQRQLRDEHVVPLDSAGRAQLMITAASMKFMGVAFSEISLCVLLTDAASAAAGAFLVQAFNSSRVFAWCERVLFSTPYQQARCAVSTAAPIRLELQQAGRVVLHAEMGSTARRIVRTGDEGWSGPVHLPKRNGDGKRTGRYFLAKIYGATSVYPFVPREDVCTIATSANHPALRSLAESGFAAGEWVVREDATHAKSKTYRGATAAHRP